jgi:hypothetical protein
MKLNRRKFLRFLGIGAGAAVAAPVLAMIPEPKLDLAALEEAYHRNVQEDLLNRIRSGVYESLENSNYHTAMKAAGCQVATREEACIGVESDRVVTPRDIRQMLATAKQDEFAQHFFHTVVTYP